MTAEALACVEKASELLGADDMGGGLTRLDEALDRLRELQQTKPQFLIGLWSEIPRRLHEDGYLPQRLGKYTKAHAQAFNLLMHYRNDITHANVSRPDVRSSEPEASRQARTTTTVLIELPPGWAAGGRCRTHPAAAPREGHDSSGMGHRAGHGPRGHAFLTHRLDCG